jgi:hypothetical protein
MSEINAIPSNTDLPIITIDKKAHSTWIKPENIIASKKIEQNGKIYEYWVLDLSHMPSAPKIFAICNRGLIAVSPSYPEQYQEAAIRHEIQENIDNVDRKDEEMICVECLKKELDEIKQDKNIDYADYIQNRYVFFKETIAYYEKKSNLTPDETIILRKIKKSFEYLETLI